MANINPVDVAYFDSFTEELMGRFQRLRHLVKNNTASGDYHEQILATVLRNFLTKRYSVKTGFIYMDKDNVSNQIDIIVVDENAPAAYIFQDGDFAIVMPEAVISVIEVKTTLNVQEYDKALKNIASVKRLIEQPSSCPGIIYRLGPDLIMWLSDNYSVAKYSTETNRVGDGKDYCSFQGIDSDKVGWQLSTLLAIIVNVCEHREFSRTHMFGQGQARRLLGQQLIEISDENYRLGSGKVA